MILWARIQNPGILTECKKFFVEMLSRFIFRLKLFQKCHNTVIEKRELLKTLQASDNSRSTHMKCTYAILEMENRTHQDFRTELNYFL